jgi:elongation factor 2
LVEMYAEPEYRDKWKVSFADNTVALGSSKDRWGFTVKQAQQKGIKFSDVIDAFSRDDIEWLRQKVPLHEALLEMVISKHPPPHVAQKYRISKIWRGDLESEVGQAMLNCDENGPTVMAVTDVRVDPQAGVVATGRLFSGTITEGRLRYTCGQKHHRPRATGRGIHGPRQRTSRHNSRRQHTCSPGNK